jgi:hypothetical protein
MPNRFKFANWRDETIVDQKGREIGVLRIKPSGVLWKRKGKDKFRRVPLDQFIEWIEDASTNAAKKQK